MSINQVINPSLSSEESSYRNLESVSNYLETDAPVRLKAETESLSFTEDNIAQAEFQSAEEQRVEALSESKTFGQWVDTADPFNNWFYDIRSEIDEFEAEEGYELRKDENAKSYFDTLQTDKYRKMLEDAAPQSQAEAEALFKAVSQKEKDEQDLASLGWKGAGAHFIANFNDPLEIGATIASSVVGLGVANSLFTAGRAARIGYTANRMLRGATVGLTEGVIAGGSKLALNDTYTLSDAVLEVSAGLALGAIGGALPTRHQRLLDELIANGKHERAAVLRDQMNRELAARGLESQGLNRMAAVNLHAADAMRLADEGLDIDAIQSTLRGTQADIEGATWRFDLYARTQKSKSGTLRWFGQHFLTDPVNKSGKASGADLAADRTYARYMGKIADASIGLFKKAKATDSTLDRDSFGEAIWKYTEHGSSGNPHIKAMADQMQDAYKEMMSAMKAAGVEGAEFLSSGGKYLPRIWNRNIYARIKNGEIAEAAVASALRNAFTATAGSAISHADIDKVVMGIINNGLKLKDDIDIIEHFSSVVKGVDPRFKKRIELDMSATSDDGSVAISDLVETNAFKLFDSYMRKMSGRLALAERGIKSSDDLKKIRDQIAKEVRESTGDDKAVKDALFAFDESTDGIYGTVNTRLAAEEAYGLTDKLRLGFKGFKSLSALNMLGGAAFAMIPEFTAATTEVGMLTVIKNMPMLRNLTNKQAKQVLSELDYMGVNLTDGQYNNFFTADVVDGTGRSKVNRTLDDINRFTFKVSLMNAGERFGRSTFVSAGVSRLAREVHKTGRISEKLRRSMYMPEADARLIESYMQSNAQVRKGFFGTEVMTLNPNNWKTADGLLDVKAHRALADGLQKLANTATSRGAAGENIPWLSGTLQSFHFQFQNTVLNSWSRIALRARYNIGHNGMGSALGMLMGGVAAWLMTNTRDGLRTLGNPEAQRKLDDRTLVERSARVASYVPAFGALYVAAEKIHPLYYMTTKQQFGGFRYESAEASWFSNPSLSYAGNLLGAPYNMLQGDYDAALRAVPMQSWYLFRPILNALMED